MSHPKNPGSQTVGVQGYLQTGQLSCHDAAGAEIACVASGQDAEFRKGIPWPEPRFQSKGDIIVDGLTGLEWTRDANPAELPMTWQEAFDYIAALNHEGAFGHDDWRLPNRRELRSLVSHRTRRPALPKDHPFVNVFPSWYWSATTAVISPSHAWYVNMDGARMFYGGKDQSFLVWPVRAAGNGALPVTGQTQCYSDTGKSASCIGTGQDGELRCGRFWPAVRFQLHDDEVIDFLTGLCWRRVADLTGAPVCWIEALAAVARLNGHLGTVADWRLPNINELESLVDCAAYGPALPRAYPFTAVQDVYWSSTTSLYQADWAWALYLDKGAVGVGQKETVGFHVWAVRDFVFSRRDGSGSLQGCR